MELELSKQVQEIENRQELPSSSESSKQIWGLTADENKVAALKRLSPAFGVMAPADLLLHSQAAMLRICVITGWQMPEDELQDILIDQFMKKLTEAYPNVNPDEFEYAFRTYGTTVQDWGKQINLGLIHQVMHPYLAAREHIGRVEDQALAREKDKAQEPVEDLSDAAMTEWMKEVINRVKAGGYTFQLLPMMLYVWLAKKGKLNKTPAEKADFLQKACNYRIAWFVESLGKAEDKVVRAKMNAFKGMVQTGEITGDEVAIIEGITRRMILFEYLLGL